MEQLVVSPESLGSVIRRQRKSKGLNQSEAGGLFNIQQKTVSDIENGAAGTRLDTLFRLFAALDLELVVRSKSSISPSEGEAW